MLTPWVYLGIYKHILHGAEEQQLSVKLDRLYNSRTVKHVRLSSLYVCCCRVEKYEIKNKIFNTEYYNDVCFFAAALFQGTAPSLFRINV